MSLIELLLSPEFVSSLIAGVVGAATTIYIFRKNSNKEVLKAQLKEVYFPLFIMLENDFYKFSSDYDFQEKIHNAHKLILSNRLIAGNDLYTKFKTFQEDQTKQSFDMLSNFIIKKYNNLLKKNRLPKITALYRAQNKLYDRYGLVFFMFRYAVVNLLQLLLALFLVSFGVSIILVTIPKIL